MQDSFKETIEVNVPLECCYHLYHYFESFPSYMGNIKQLRHLPGDVWEWVRVGKYGDESVWRFTVEAEEPHRLIRLKAISPPDADIPISCILEARFEKLGLNQTLMTFEVHLITPDVPLSNMIKELFGVSENDFRGCFQDFRDQLEKVHAQVHSAPPENKGMPANQRESAELQHTALDLEKS